MATTRIWPVHDSLARVLDYAENHLKTANPDAYTVAELKDLREVLSYAANDEKTAQQFYVTGVNCIGEIAFKQMTATKERFGKTDGNLAYHAYQSFAPDEVTPERCHQIGVELARRLWGDKYEILVSTHLNTHCVHNHFVINSVSFSDGKKFNNDLGMYFNVLRKGSDKICAEYGLTVIENPGRSGGSKWMQQAEKRGEPTMWNVIRSDIDEAIRRSMTDKQFYRQMKEWGYTFDFNPNRKYPTIRPPGSEKVTRFKTLGESYTPEIITKRILENHRPFIPAQQKPPEIRRYHFRGSFHNVKSVSGIYIMYLIFMLILRRISNRSTDQPQRTIYTPELRAAIRQMEKYSAETRLLCRYKIETPEQLKEFINTKNQQRKDLEHQRGKVYNKMKSAKTPEQKETLVEQRNQLSAEIKVIRRELFYAGDIEERHEEIRQKLRRQREHQARQLALNNPLQNKTKERGRVR